MSGSGFLGVLLAVLGQLLPPAAVVAAALLTRPRRPDTPPPDANAASGASQPLGNG